MKMKLSIAVYINAFLSFLTLMLLASKLSVYGDLIFILIVMFLFVIQVSFAVVIAINFLVADYIKLKQRKRGN